MLHLKNRIWFSKNNVPSLKRELSLLFVGVLCGLAGVCATQALADEQLAAVALSDSQSSVQSGVPTENFILNSNQCHTLVENTVINIEGWAIDLRAPIESSLKSHRYLPVSDQGDARSILSMSYGQQNGGFFNKALVQMHWTNLATGEVVDFSPTSKTCLNAICSIYDFRAAALKSVRRLQSELTDCAQ